LTGGGVSSRGPSPEDWRALLTRADAAMEHAYAPYSGFRVGAALLTSNGMVVEGCNVENVSFPAGSCAERVAVGAAVVRGLREFEALAIVTEADVPTPPCGFCRQVLLEFAPALPVLSVTRGGAEARWDMSELLPHAFTPTSLKRP
jgi:cytidine deaminase